MTISPVIAPITASAAHRMATTGGTAFRSVLTDAIKQGNIDRFMKSDGGDPNRVAVLLEVRNQVISAYQEVMSMQV